MVNITMTSIENKIEVPESSYITTYLYTLRSIVVHKKVQYYLYINTISISRVRRGVVAVFKPFHVTRTIHNKKNCNCNS
jgi:hypothetical protein